MTRIVRLSCGASAVALLFSVVTPAQAQQNDVDTTSVAVEEVVVTARKREESLQEVPVTVSAVGEDEIEASGARTMSDLSRVVPNVNFVQSTNFTRMLQPIIRGGGQGDVELSSEPATAIYIDGVYQARTDLTNTNVNDVQQVEVLKGPQGTLFGRNTTAGAVIITTKRPTPEFGGEVSVSVGNYGRFDVHSNINIPLLPEKAFLNLTANRERFDGYFKHATTGENLGWTDPYQSFRAKLLLLMSDSVEALLSYDYFDGRTQPQPGINSTGFLPLGGAYMVTDPFRPNLNFDLENTFTGGGVSGQVDWDLGFATLTSITAYRESQDTWQNDADVSPLTVYHLRRTGEQQYVTQELRIANEGDERLSYTAGIFLFSSDYMATSRNDVNFGAALPSGGTVTNEFQRAEQHSTSQAVFGEASYRITPALRVFGGLRWSFDQKEFRRSQRRVNSSGVVLVGNANTWATPPLEASWEAPSYRIGLDWKPNEDTLVYTSYSRGYKGGGFVGRANTFDAASVPYDPEYTDAYELGVKSDLMDRRLRVNLAAFYAVDTDLQTFVVFAAPGGGTNSLIINVGELVRKGVEAEVDFRITENLRIAANGGWTDASYTDFFGPVLSTTPGDYSHLQPRFYAEKTGNVALLYEHPTSWGEAFFGANVYYNSGFFGDVANTPSGRVDPYTVGSVNFGVRTDDGWELRANINNVTDETYWTTHTVIGGFWTQSWTAPPRDMRLTLTRRF